MSIDCNACERLRQIAPELETTGLTTRMCTSLGNDTGLNNSISPLHTDKADMDDMADCGVGRMAQEIKLYDVCDWQEYMKKFVPNLHDVLKAINCVDAGQWKNIHDLWEYSKMLCEKQTLLFSPAMDTYGYLPFYDSYVSEYYGDIYKLGTVGKKAGVDLIHALGTAPLRYRAGSGVGIEYSKKQLEDCNGNCQLFEWIGPHFYNCTVDASASPGDILWYCDKASFKSVTGCTENLWRVFTKITDSTPNAGGGWRWENCPMENGKFGWLFMWADPDGMGEDYMVLQWRGTSYPNDALASNLSINDNTESSAYVVRTSC